MSADDSDAQALARLNVVLRGPVQQVADAWGAVQPQLQPSQRALASAVRDGEAAAIEFAYRRAEVLHRRIGALLEAIGRAVEALEGLAEVPGIETVQARVSIQLHALASMKRTLVRHLRLANQLQAQAEVVQKAARRRDASTDADWERLRARLADTEAVAKALAKEMAGFVKHSDSGAALTSPARMAQLQDAAARVAARAPRRDVDALQRELDRIAMLVDRDLVRNDFAVQWKREQAGVARSVEALRTSIAALASDAAAIAQLRARLDAAAIARALGVPLAVVRQEERRLAGSGSAPLAAVAAIAERAQLDRAPKDLLGDLRREGWVA
jgi:hypothetical protein